MISRLLFLAILGYLSHHRAQDYTAPVLLSGTTISIFFLLLLYSPFFVSFSLFFSFFNGTKHFLFIRRCHRDLRVYRQDPGERKLEKSNIPNSKSCCECCQVVFHPVVTLGGSEFYLVPFFSLNPIASSFFSRFFFIAFRHIQHCDSGYTGPVEYEVGSEHCEVSVCAVRAGISPRLRRHSKFLFKRTDRETK